jgi:branched-chain amino acid transport system substrate-binding protein
LSVVSASADEIVKLVSSLPRTGSANGQASSIVNGIKMALDEVNYKVGDFKLIYQDLDDASPERGQWDPAIEAANADKAIRDPDVMVYMANYNSGAAKISIPKTNAAGLVQVNLGATYPGLAKPGTGEPNEPKIYRPSGKPNFFTVVPSDDIQGMVAAKWAKEFEAKRVFVVHDGELYGKGVATIFKKSAKNLGIDVVGFEQLDPKASNYKSLSIKIKQLAPEVIFAGMTTQSNAGQFVKDVVSSGAKSTMILPDGCYESAFIESAGREILEGRAYIVFGGIPPSKLEGKGRDFYLKYKEKYKSEPEAYAVYGYEAGKVALEGIRRAGKKDRAAILEAIAGIRDFEGALGKWSFDENGATSLRTFSGNTVKDGKFEFVKLLD